MDMVNLPSASGPSRVEGRSKLNVLSQFESKNILDYSLSPLAFNPCTELIIVLNYYDPVDMGLTAWEKEREGEIWRANPLTILLLHGATILFQLQVVKPLKLVRVSALEPYGRGILHHCHDVDTFFPLPFAKSIWQWRGLPFAISSMLCT